MTLIPIEDLYRYTRVVIVNTGYKAAKAEKKEKRRRFRVVLIKAARKINYNTIIETEAEV